MLIPLEGSVQNKKSIRGLYSINSRSTEYKILIPLDGIAYLQPVQGICTPGGFLAVVWITP